MVSHNENIRRKNADYEAGFKTEIVNLLHLDLDLVIIDEVVFSLKACGERSWWTRGQECNSVERVPSSGGANVAAIAAVSHRRGKISFKAKIGYFNSAEAVSFMDQLSLLITEPVILLLDNASIHKGEAMRLWFDQHPNFRRVFLPAYSPWYSSIETVFALQKRVYRKLVG